MRRRYRDARPNGAAPDPAGEGRNREQSERGASLVEFAVVAPLLILLLFGIIEVGWLFAQQVEIRHGAREAARVAAVSATDVTDSAYSGIPDGSFTYHDVVARGCEAMALSGGTASIRMAASGTEVGDVATVTVDSTYETLTGVLDRFFAGLTTSTEVDIRLEQPRAWDPTGAETCP